MSNICDNQQDFNIGMYKAVKQYRHDKTKKMSSAFYSYGTVWMIFFIWAIILSFKQQGSSRTVHFLFAILFSPAYVIAYYLSKLN
jgi:hypothetical protein